MFDLYKGRITFSIIFLFAYKGALLRAEMNGNSLLETKVNKKTSKIINKAKNVKAKLK